MTIRWNAAARWIAGLCAGLSAFVLAAGAGAQGIDEADLLPVEEAFIATSTITPEGDLQVRFQIAEDYYLYRERLKFSAEPPVVLGAPELPSGEEKDDPILGLTEVYRDVLEIRVPVQAHGAAELNLTLGYQGCADAGLCYPPQRQMISLLLPARAADTAAAPAAAPLSGLGGTPHGLALPGTAATSTGLVDDALPEDQAFRFEAIASNAHTVLARFVVAPGYYLYRDQTTFALAGVPDGGGLGLPQWPAAQTLMDDHFGEVAVYFDTVEVPLEVTRPAGGPLKLSLLAAYQGCKRDGICYPIMRRSVDVELPASDHAHAARETAPAATATGASGNPSGTPGSLWLALLLAIAGGLILNLMPCVLPVLSMKAISLAESGRSSGHARSHALWYTAGVLVSFAVVGLAAVLLRNAGQALGWGFQLQQPAFVAVLVLVMTGVGLSLSGVVSFGNSLMGAGQQLTEGSGARSAFFTGVLAVVVASPCTAPFMFGALGYAFAQPPALSLLVFLALGLGLALPFLLIGFIPALANRLPRPGAWMEHFKQWMAFPMYLTAIWLLWVLGQQRGPNAMGVALVACVLLAAALWWWEAIKYGGGRGRVFGVILVLGLLAGSAYGVWMVHGMAPPTKGAQAASDGPSEPYTPARLEALLAAGTPVFINMTADWCATCKVNEGTSLSTESFQTALRDTGTVYLKGDWTNTDPDITAFLQRFNAVGVPLYVSFDRQGQPTVLPTVLTPGLVHDAVRTAGSAP